MFSEEVCDTVTFVVLWLFFVSRYRVRLRAASRRSSCDVMLYRSNTDSVLCPEIFIATLRGTPARMRFRTRGLRRSLRNPSHIASVFRVIYTERRVFAVNDFNHMLKQRTLIRELQKISRRFLRSPSWV